MEINFDDKIVIEIVWKNDQKNVQIIAKVEMKNQNHLTLDSVRFFIILFFVCFFAAAAAVILGITLCEGKFLSQEQDSQPRNGSSIFQIKENDFKITGCT